MFLSLSGWNLELCEGQSGLAREDEELCRSLTVWRKRRGLTVLVREEGWEVRSSMQRFVPGRFTPGVQVGKSVGSVGEQAGWRAQLVREGESVGSEQGIGRRQELQSELLGLVCPVGYVLRRMKMVSRMQTAYRTWGLQ
ncbi:hypothetical protein GOODEAATRI_021339 [Goodea atripinnis]|uniref:Uncharacterized protein n=1 Tax=Goodea atripinnis TaxID=208336 RepID=A0ABV0MJJ9_9TELE